MGVDREGMVVNPASNSLRSHLVQNKPPRGSTSSDPSQSAGVYHVPCGGCELAYYGETGRSIDVRVGEHQGAIRRRDTRNACYKHVSSTKHEIDFENTHVVYKSDDWYNRLVVESSCIVTLPNFNNMRSTLAIDKLSADIILNKTKNVLL